VFLGWIALHFDKSGIVVFRVVRVLRPLRTINSIPGMAGLVKTIFKALPAIGNIFLLFAFFIMVFGVIGMQLFSGMLRKQCVFTNDPGIVYAPGGNEFFCLVQTCP
jgi:hypothetical protein